MVILDFSDFGTKASAKMVDLAPHAQVQSEIYGWRIKVGNFFTADYTAAPLQFLYTKMVGNVRGDQASGAAFQSELTNIKWSNDRNSTFIEELKRLLNTDENLDGYRLSIRFNLDLMDDYHFGRIVGKCLFVVFLHTIQDIITIITWSLLQCESDPPAVEICFSFSFFFQFSVYYDCFIFTF